MTEESDDNNSQRLEEEEQSYPQQHDDNSSVLTLRIQESGRASQQPSRVHVAPTDTVAALKRAVLAVCRAPNESSSTSKQQQQGVVEPTDSYYVRLIAAGRLLAPDQAGLAQFALQPDQAIHAVIVAEEQQQTSQQQPKQPQLRGAQAVLQQQGGAAALSRRALRAAGVNEAGWAVRRTEEDEDDDEEEDEFLVFQGSGDVDEEESLVDLEAGMNGGGGISNSSSNNSISHRRNHAAARLPLGLDRLRVTHGLGRADIMALRIYFNAHIDRWLQQQQQADAENDTANNNNSATAASQRESDALRRRRLQEEEWMRAQGPASEFRLNLNLHSNNSNNNTLRFGTGADNNMMTTALLRHGSVVGTDRDFVWGFLLGFFVGFLMLIWIWLPTVPHKQKLGILTGYSFHLALGMLKGGPGSGHPNDDPDAPIVGLLD